MALNSSPLDPFSYNGDYHDSFMENKVHGIAIPNESSPISANYAPNAFGYSSSPAHNFNKEDECDIWIDAMDQNCCNNNNSYGSSFDMNKEFNSNSTSGAIGDHNSSGEHGRFVFPYPFTSHINYVQESLRQEKLLQKRRYGGLETQMAKKQCGTNKKSRGRINSPSKDPQGLAAKNRWERISQRLRVLQELVPNGTKVDMVTMLEKAIGYVKFLQLQVKVLATDEFWPEQEGKTLDISQVKDALDAILSSQKDIN